MHDGRPADPTACGPDHCGKGGDYVAIVKEHQPQLRADIALVFTLPPAGDRQETARTVDRPWTH